MKKKDVLKIPLRRDKKLKALIILLFNCILLIPTGATVLPQAPFSLSATDKTFKETLKEIEKNSQLHSFYNEKLTDPDKTVYPEVNNVSKQELLEHLFNDRMLTYQLLDDNLVVITPQLKQGFSVKGKVADANGNPLPGVNVREKGTNNGTVTDLNGNYTLEVSSSDAVLSFSYVGFLTKEIEVKGQTTIDITLSEDILSLEEVVVIGYGTQKKGDVTSAISSIKSEDFLVGKMQDASELIKGKVAGLTITKSSGDPNASSSIMLRGISTLEGSTSPLVLVDGIPGDITSVAPENIESIDILKDASAAAIYGTRGANGVIIITTKSGRREEHVEVNYSGYVSVSDFLKEAEFMSPGDIRKGLTSFSDDGWDTDWVKAVTRNGFTNNHNISIHGGSSKTIYSGNFSYRYEEGTIKKTDNRENKMQLNITQYVLNDILKLNLNLLKGIHKNSANSATKEGITNIYRQAVIHNPTSPIYEEETGEYYEEFGRYQYYNPVAMINEFLGEYRSDWTHISGNATLEPIKNWRTSLMLASHRFSGDNSTYSTSDYYLATTTGHQGSADKSFANTEKNYLEVTSRYEAELGSMHRFSALGGYSYSEEVYDGFNASNSDFPTDSYRENNISVGTLLREGEASMVSYKNDNKLIGFFGRATYSFNNKYNLLLSVRREGSSKFGENHKWGTFPSVSAGWIISDEAFMGQLDWISNLKLRVGYGVTGVIPGNSYFSLTTYDYDSDYGNYVDENGNWVAGLQVTQNPNPDLKWEKTAETNIGLDFSLLKGRLNGAIDLYERKTTDLLYDYNVPVPPNLYSTTKANVGSMRNRGIEVMVNGSPLKTNSFEWNTTVTVSHNKNELLSLSNDLYETENYMNVAYVGDPITVPTHRIEVGKSLGNYWGLRSVGVTEDGLWLIENPATGEAETYSTSMNSDDYRQYLGNGIPKVYMGWNNTFRYKGIELGVQISGQFGFQILNEQRMFYENNYIQYNRLKSAADLVYGISRLSSSQAQAFVSYYLEDGDYVKLDNVTLGYTINTQRIAKYISRVYFYVAGQNLVCITAYKGLDPELDYNGLNPGVNYFNKDEEKEPGFFGAGNDYRDKYPTIRSFTLGVNVTF